MSRPRRRVRVEAAPGVDPTPQRFDVARPDRAPAPVLAAEDRLGAWGDDGLEVRADAASDSNDARLDADRPPHYA